mmetsp:Transcript_27009/g.85845  ORF Transcript_27009/g.85845 Transcript_27009/m.85845 type:complete len:208 (+) Transcript_27009:171-794(+)
MTDASLSAPNAAAGKCGAAVPAGSATVAALTATAEGVFRSAATASAAGSATSSAAVSSNVCDPRSRMINSFSVGVRLLMLSSSESAQSAWLSAPSVPAPPPPLLLAASGGATLATSDLVLPCGSSAPSCPIMLHFIRAMTALCPWATSCGQTPLLFCCSGLAPAANSSRQRPTSPLEAASIRGVSPWASPAQASALLLSSSRTTAKQ